MPDLFVSRLVVVVLCALAIFNNPDATQAAPAGWNDGKRGIARDLLENYSDPRDIEKVANASVYALLAWAAYGEAEAISMLKERDWELLGPPLKGKRVVVGDVSASLFEGPNEQLVLAFRGTQTGGDWVTNIFGTLSPKPLLNLQVHDAIDIAERVTQLFPDVVYVGHSLGGRLAQAASMKTGNTSYAFNSAPVGLNELLEMGILGVVRKEARRFRSPQDQLSGVFSPADTLVANIPEVEAKALFNLINAKDYTHAMGVLAKAMDNVSIAWNEGWITAYLNEQNGTESTDPLEPTEWGPSIVPPAGIELGEAENWIDLQDPMKEKFGASCRATDHGDVACPYVQTGSCGEGCRKSGILQTTSTLLASKTPGGEHNDLVLRPGEIYAFEKVNTYSVPCKGIVRRSAGFQLRPGKEVVRIGINNEGQYFYLQDEAVAQSTYDDEISFATECSAQNEIWYSIVSKTGERGWVKNDGTLLGTSYFDGHTFAALPEWTWPYFDYSAYVSRTRGNICSVVGRPLNQYEIIKLFEHTRAEAEYLNGSSRITYTKAAGDREIKWFDHEKRTGNQYQGVVTVDQHEVCTPIEDSKACYIFRECRDHQSARLVGEFTRLPVSLRGVAPGYNVGEQFGYLTNISKVITPKTEINTDEVSVAAQDDYIVEGMDKVDSELLRKCYESELVSCLRRSGVSTEVAKAYEKLRQIFDARVGVEAFTDLGFVDLAELFFFDYANSNWQVLPVNSGPAFTLDVAFRSGIDDLIRTVNWPHARYISRNTPDFIVDLGRGSFSYYKRHSETGSSFYFNYPIKKACRACEILGSATIKYEFFADSLHHEGTGALVSVFSARASGLPEISMGEENAKQIFAQHPIFLQQKLNSIGYDAGSLDGVIGAKTVGALADFQFAHCIEPSGKLDNKTAKALFHSSSLNGGCFDD